jgi:gluconolactonase
MSYAVRAWPAAALLITAFAQDPRADRIEWIARDYTYAKGPAWSKDGYLVFSDTPADRILRWQPGHPREVLREGAAGPAGNAFDAQGRLYTCETRARRVIRMERNGKIEALAESWEGKRLNAPNDLAVSRSGHVYFTDPAFGESSDRRELDFYGVYHIPPKGPMKLVAKPAGRPNGIALSPNGRVLYVGNADEHNIRAYDLDRDGDASNERVLVAGIADVPGGIAVDEKGNLYVAAGSILIYSPEGRPLGTIEMSRRASGCAFGDTDGKTLLVTAGGDLVRVLREAQGAN